jgi:hypothetical protein
MVKCTAYPSAWHLLVAKIESRLVNFARPFCLLMRSIVLIMSVIVAGGLKSSASDGLPMHSFSINLPNHNLRFALPETIVQDMHPFEMESKLDPRDRTLSIDGFRDVARHGYEFKRALGFGTKGWFRFSFGVVKPLKDSNFDITTTDGLDEYIRWWLVQKGSSVGFQFDRSLQGGQIWLRREKNTFVHPASDGTGLGSHERIICVPLTKEMFFQASFLISESVPGSAKKWESRAEVFREAIEASLSITQN